MLRKSLALLALCGGLLGLGLAAHSQLRLGSDSAALAQLKPGSVEAVRATLRMESLLAQGEARWGPWPGAAIEERAQRAFTLVTERFEHGDRAQHRLDELWPMWVLGQLEHDASYRNGVPALMQATTGLLCHQVAHVLVQAWLKLGVPGREVGLGGHVVAEAHWQGRWHLFDPDYKVRAQPDWPEQDHHDFARHPAATARLYAQNPTVPAATRPILVNIYATELDNGAPTQPLGVRYVWSLAVLEGLEQASRLLMWLLPLACLGLSGALVLGQRRAEASSQAWNIKTPHRG